MHKKFAFVENPTFEQARVSSEPDLILNALESGAILLAQSIKQGDRVHQRRVARIRYIVRLAIYERRAQLGRPPAPNHSTNIIELPVEPLLTP